MQKTTRNKTYCIICIICAHTTWFIYKRSQYCINLFVACILYDLFQNAPNTISSYLLYFPNASKTSSYLLYSSGCHRPSSDWKVRASPLAWGFVCCPCHALATTWHELRLRRPWPNGISQLGARGLWSIPPSSPTQLGARTGYYRAKGWKRVAMHGIPLSGFQPNIGASPRPKNSAGQNIYKTNSPTVPFAQWRPNGEP